MKRIIAFFGLALFFFLCLSPAVSAQESDPLEDVQSDLWESIPEEIRPLLPEGLETGDGEGVARMIDGEYVMGLIGYFLRDASGQALKLFALLLSVVVLGTLAERMGEMMGGEHTKIFSWIFTLCAGVLVFSHLITAWQLTLGVLSAINDFMTTLASLLTVLYLAGGNSVTAAVHMGWISWMLTLSEKLSYGFLLPVLEISFSGTLISSIAGSINLRPFVKSMQRFTVTLITLIMTVLSVIMTFQTSLAAAADSVAMRAMKYAAAGSVPIIGGMVSESIRTLSAGISALKGMVGTVGVTVVILLSLSPMLTLLFTRWALSIAGSIAEAVGGETVPALIADASKLVGFFMAVLAIFDLFFIYSLSIFVRTAVA